MALAINDVVRLSAVCKRQTADLQVITFDVKIDVAGSDGNAGFQEDAVDFVDDLMSEVTAVTLDSIVSDQVTFYHRTGTEYLPPKTWVGFQGGQSGDPLPYGTFAVAILRTAIRGIRGRKFMYATDESSNVEGQPAGAYPGYIQNWIDALLTPEVGANGWEFHTVIWSTTLEGDVEITDGVPSDEWGRLVSRKPGRGA